MVRGPDVASPPPHHGLPLLVPPPLLLLLPVRGEAEDVRGPEVHGGAETEQAGGLLGSSHQVARTFTKRTFKAAESPDGLGFYRHVWICLGFNKKRAWF